MMADAKVRVRGLSRLLATPNACLGPPVARHQVTRGTLIWAAGKCLGGTPPGHCLLHCIRHMRQLHPPSRGLEASNLTPAIRDSETPSDSGTVATAALLVPPRPLGNTSLTRA